MMEQLLFFQEASKKSYNVLEKARQFNKQKCISEVYDCDLFTRRFKVLPLRQNKKTQFVEIISGERRCTCDAYQIDRKVCSHILAVKLYLEVRA